ncbi:MAG: hypothetical protein KDA78_01025 [Planctomycetaceae bacterium]|nr:hypothetical protein [Planctomycetaceae bacterium]
MDAAWNKQRVFTRIGRQFWLRSRFFDQFFLALTAVFWGDLFLTTWGTGALSGIAAGLGIAGGLLISRRPVTTPRWLAPAILAGLTLSSPVWWPAWCGLISVAGSGSSFLGMLGPVALQSGLITVLFWLARSSSSLSGRKSAEAWTGLSLGVICSGLILGPFVPLYWLACAGVVLRTVFAVLNSWRTPLPGWVLSPSGTSASKFIQNTELRHLLLPLLAGILAPALWLHLMSLQAPTTLFWYGCMASALLGLAAGARGSNWFGMCSGLIWFAVAVAAFPLWIRYYLFVSSYVSSVSLSTFLRVLALTCFWFPWGVMLGRTFQSRVTRTVRSGQVLAFLLATQCSWWLIPNVSTAGILSVGILCWLGLAYRFDSPRSNSTASTSIQRFLPYALPCAVLLAAVATPFTFDSILATRALYSTYAFQSWSNGTPLDQLNGLDDGRLIQEITSTDGRISFWKHQGTHLQIRKNGIPAGRISLNDGLAPQPTGSLLSAVLPLSIHESPRNVLLVGMEAGLGLQTTLEFPVMQVVCTDKNPVMWQQMQNGQCGPSVQQSTTDDRVQFIACASSLLLPTENHSFDVILESPGHSASYANSASYHLPHYRAMANRLSEHGLYCQRFVFTDYGPEVILSLALTLEQTFGYVTAFDTAPGELLFVAARTREDVLAAGLIDRISSPQVSRSLAHVGWDWSVAMNLARFETEDLISGTAPALASAFSGTMAFGRCTEMMRWGDKWGEVRNLLAQHPKRLLDHYAEEKKMEDVLRRLSDIAARERVLNENPDEFWVYRTSVKKRLQDNPRSVIKPVKGEGIKHVRHPDDERRLEYFEALGLAKQTHPVSLEQLLNVEQFESPYDPLISHFLHAELAKMYEQCEPAEPERELGHWLYAVYYGGRQERSVRGIHRAVELLTSEVNLPAEERYDHLNALLEILQARWHMRRGKADISQPVLMIDLQDSLQASQSALECMHQIAMENHFDLNQTQSREDHLERSLVRMIRSYRTELLAAASRTAPPTPPAEAKNEN